MALRLMVYDKTCTGRGLLPGLTHSWMVGARLYGALGRLDASFGATSWSEALDFCATYRPQATIREIQFWGHGNWGTAKIDGEVLGVESLEANHPHRPRLERIRDRFEPDGLWWFRTCETFGTERGQTFAAAFADFMRVRVAGHTYVIWCAQSGLHTLRPGDTPDWPVDEGLSPKTDLRARWSTVGAPNTISFLTGTIPKGY
ncbi:MAG: hypothetical protein RIT81_42910 [Deltaproteobacteria bacterium]